MIKKSEAGLVFSTDHGKMCSECNKPVANCSCKQDAQVFSGDGIVRVGRETKGRKGKGVTLITGYNGSESDLKKLCKELKARCGCGGAVKNHIIEIQGDHRDTIVEELEKKGLTVKRSGG
jgi:translation initiation factor 1